MGQFCERTGQRGIFSGPWGCISPRLRENERFARWRRELFCAFVLRTPMALQLAVEPRDTQGKHRNRRLRRSGKIPAILYGHGVANVSAERGSRSHDRGDPPREPVGQSDRCGQRIGLHPRVAVGHVGDAHRSRRFHADFRARDRRGPRARRTARRGARRAGGWRGRATHSRGGDRLSGLGDSRAAGRERQPLEARASRSLWPAWSCRKGPRFSRPTWRPWWSSASCRWKCRKRPRPRRRRANRK